MSDDEIVLHLNPVWRDRANFIIHAKIEPNKPGKTLEQLWTKQLSDRVFEICCIPFFVYDLALGDQIDTAADEEKQYILRTVIKQSGHYTFRAWFGRSDVPDAREEVLRKVSELGCLYEWYSHNLVGMDAADSQTAQQLADFLHVMEVSKKLVYETGRTK